MRENLAYRGRGAELGPVPLHWCIKLELTVFRQPQRAYRHEWLAHRIRLNEAVRLPQPARSQLGVTAPQIYHEAVVTPRRERRTGTRLRRDNVCEAIPHHSEPRVRKAMRIHPSHTVSWDAVRDPVPPAGTRDLGIDIGQAEMACFGLTRPGELGISGGQNQ